MFWTVLAGAVTDFVLNLIWIPEYAATGAAMGTLVAECVVLVLQAYALREVFFPAMREIPFGKVLLALSLACAVSVPVKLLAAGVFWKLLCSAVMFFAVYLVVLLLTGEALVREVLRHPITK